MALLIIFEATSFHTKLNENYGPAREFKREKTLRYSYGVEVRRIFLYLSENVQIVQKRHILLISAQAKSQAKWIFPRKDPEQKKEVSKSNPYDFPYGVNVGDRSLKITVYLSSAGKTKSK